MTRSGAHLWRVSSLDAPFILEFWAQLQTTKMSKMLMICRHLIMALFGCRKVTSRLRMLCHGIRLSCWWPSRDNAIRLMLHPLSWTFGSGLSVSGLPKWGNVNALKWDILHFQEWCDSLVVCHQTGTQCPLTRPAQEPVEDAWFYWSVNSSDRCPIDQLMDDCCHLCYQSPLQVSS